MQQRLERLEQYLDTVNDSLKRLPLAEREREIAELRQHLEAMAQARSELGDYLETAVDGAIQQFGPAQTTGHHLVATHRRRRAATFLNQDILELIRGQFTTHRRRRLSAFRQSWLGALVCTIFTVYAVYVYAPVVLEMLIPYNPRNPSNNPTVLLWYGYIGCMLEGWLMGWLSCRLSGRRCLPVLGAIAIWFNLYCIWPQIVRGPDSYEVWRLLLMVASSTLVLPILAAYLSLNRLSPSFRKA